MRRYIVAIFVIFALICSFSSLAHAAATKKVNINSASVKELATLKKIGPKYSQKIVDYRNAMGPFDKPEDIMKVKGISDKIFEMNKERIVVKDETAKKKS